ncbi:MAG: M56 family metallopeptidase [Lachnospiraceae bacterium]|nr:M56 family metallopeptidase [Lachnospiraceae bacterium]
MVEVLVTSSVMILGILCLRKLTMGKISMRVRYAFWLLVAVRLLMPVSVGTSPISVLNLVSGIHQEYLFSDGVAQEADGQENAVKEEESRAAQRKEDGAETVHDLQNTAQEADGQSLDRTPVIGGAQKIPGSSPVDVIWVVWFLGFLTVSGYMLFMRVRFVRYLRKNRKKIAGEEIPVIIGEKLAGRGMRVYRVKGLPSPCLVGRHIYIGEQTAEVEQGLAHILAHEYCHAVHGDGFWALLRCALAAVYWFDPFVWVAAFAARQDSDLACDEAAVRLLGEEERFAYGRTLLALLQKSGGKAECPGMPLMFSGGERSVRERIVALADRNKAEAVVLVAVLSMVCLLCGCAFTGAQTDEAVSDQEENGQEMDENVQHAIESVDRRNEELTSEMDIIRALENELNKEAAQIQAEYEETDLVKRPSFEEVLNYHGVMEGKDDSELTLNRKIDYQAYYEYLQGEGENPMINGWYLLCENEREGISLYGLYTEQFGFRGVKTQMEVGGDVNTFDIEWYPSRLNQNKENIRVLERESNGLARRFVWKLMAEESSVVEIWHLYSAYQYDTGTIDLKVLTEKECIAWAEQYLAFSVNQETNRVGVVCDGDMALGGLDISAYEGYEIESAQIDPYALAFDLYSDAYGEDYEDGYEGIVVQLAPGLKLKDSDKVWIDQMQIIDVQVAEEESGFQLQQPRIDENFVAQNIAQRNGLAELKKGQSNVGR